MRKDYCLGSEFPVKNTCRRYTEGIEFLDSDKLKSCYMRKCTSQKKYLQDETKIVKGR